MDEVPGVDDLRSGRFGESQVGLVNQHSGAERVSPMLAVEVEESLRPEIPVERFEKLVL